MLKEWKLSILTDIQIVLLTCATFILYWTNMVNKLVFAVFFLITAALTNCLDWVHDWLYDILKGKLATKLILAMVRDGDLVCEDCSDCRGRGGNVDVQNVLQIAKVNVFVTPSPKDNVMQLRDMPELLDSADLDEVRALPFPVGKANNAPQPGPQGKGRKSGNKRRR